MDNNINVQYTQNNSENLSIVNYENIQNCEPVPYGINTLILPVGNDLIFNKNSVSDITDSSLRSLLAESGIIKTKLGFCEIRHPGDYIIVTGLTDFVWNLKNKIILQGFNNEEKKKHKYEIEITCADGKKFVIVEFAYKLKDLSEFERLAVEYGFLNTQMNKKQHKDMMIKELSNNDIPVIIEFLNAGFNYMENDTVFVTKNASYCYNKQEVLLSDKVKLSSNASFQPEFVNFESILIDKNIKSIFGNEKITPEKFVSFLLKLLFDIIEKAYNGNICAYFVISMGFMTLFLKQINDDFKGAPIVSAYGEAASGKSNLLELVAHSFGLDVKAFHSGADTYVGLLQTLGAYANIPLLLDEVDREGIKIIQKLIKSSYGQTTRRKYNSKNDINTTIFFNTNYDFLTGLEYKTRCIELNFEQCNFNGKEASKFNQYKKYLSFISKYIIKNIPYSKIKDMIENEDNSEILSNAKDGRTRRNLAIATTGLKLLIKLINQEEIDFSQFEERLNSYIEETTRYSDDDVDKFIVVLQALINENGGKLVRGRDYSIRAEGIHIIISEKKNKAFNSHFRNTFMSIYKGMYPLEMKAYKKPLIEKGAKMDNAHYSDENKTKYGLLLPFDKFGELSYLLAGQKAVIFETMPKNNENNPF